MIENVFEIICFVLLGTNALTLYWALKKRVPVNSKFMALKGAIQAFEAQGDAILHISKINPDDVYLRNPQR